MTRAAFARRQWPDAPSGTSALFGGAVEGEAIAGA
jgi:hypothetical protein